MAGLAFLTGFPGFLGTRLVRRLLERDPDLRVAALVEARMLAGARAAAERIDPGRVEVLAGDIGDRRLGLSPPDYERIAAEASAVYHLAAIYDLSVPLETAQHVNVEGTGNVLELCSRCERLDRFHYVSTAYVAGLRRGVVYEHELAVGQRFKNHYESTKYQAEVWVRAAMGEVPTTIYRPAIVVGDSRTGETQKFDGPYYMLRTIAVMERRGLPIFRFGRSAAPMNLVPVDFVIEAMVVAGGEPRAIGHTLHLVDPEPAPAAEVMSTLSRLYAGREPSYPVPAALVGASLRLKPVRRLFGGAPAESLPYLNHPVRFDTRRAQGVLEPNGLRPPRFHEYAEPMVRFFREHEHDPAFGWQGLG